MLSFILLVALVSPSLAKNNRIVGGAPAADAAWPWQCALYTPGNSFTCGCVLASPNYVLTAAHCVGIGTYTMKVGTNSNSAGMGTMVPSIRVEANPDYDDSTPGAFPNDVCVIETAGLPINGGNVQFVPAIEAAGAGDDDRINHECWITGWGRLVGGGPLPVALQEVRIPVISNAVASSQWGINYNPNVHICVWDAVGQDIGSCNGDSGGPLVCRADMSQAWTLLGLTSWGASGCLTSYPSCYCRVSSFRAFICSASMNEVC